MTARCDHPPPGECYRLVCRECGAVKMPGEPAFYPMREWVDRALLHLLSVFAPVDEREERAVE